MVKDTGDGRGKGVFLTSCAKQGDYLWSYEGEVISKREHARRLPFYEDAGLSYILEVKDRGESVFVDVFFFKNCPSNIYVKIVHGHFAQIGRGQLSKIYKKSYFVYKYDKQDLIDLAKVAWSGPALLGQA